jgi:hypothetical protein
LPEALLSAVGLSATTALAAVDSSKLPPAAATKVDYTRDVQPLLESRCYQCHGPKRTENGLRLDDRDLALKGGERGPILMPGNSAESLVIHAVAHARERHAGDAQEGRPAQCGANWTIASVDRSGG